LKIFLKPLKKLKILREGLIYDIFSNLESIVHLHHDISASLTKLEDEANAMIKLEKMVETYEANSDEFYLYKIYCANQSNSLRVLKSLDQLQEFMGFLSVY
jgi:hypothetical protein